MSRVHFKCFCVKLDDLPEIAIVRMETGWTMLLKKSPMDDGQCRAREDGDSPPLKVLEPRIANDFSTRFVP
jgi:hypothetical protein